MPGALSILRDFSQRPQLEAPFLAIELLPHVNSTLVISRYLVRLLDKIQSGNHNTYNLDPRKITLNGVSCRPDLNLKIWSHKFKKENLHSVITTTTEMY